MEAVLKLRDRKRDECRRNLGQAIGQLTQIEALDGQILNEQAELRAYLKELSRQGAVSVGMVSRCQMHLAQLERKHQQALVARSEALRVVELAREKLIAADQDVKVMEKLREKQFEAHQKEVERRERLEQEEILAASRYGKLFS